MSYADRAKYRNIEPLKLTLTSFNDEGEERVHSLEVPPRWQGQQSIHFAGWDLTVYEDGTLVVERDSAVTGAIALRPTLSTLDGVTDRVTLKPYDPETGR